jgi:hypothetical protein
LHQRGLNALNRGRPLLGARAFRAGLRIAPDDVRLLNSLAAAEAALGDTEQGFAAGRPDGRRAGVPGPGDSVAAP